LYHSNIINTGGDTMKQKRYSDEFKEQIIRECQETGNVAIVARRYEISANTIYTWIRKYRQRGSVKALPRKQAVRVKEMEQRLKKVSLQNDQLKRLLAEKELELSILREIRDLENPQ
jgi:transposase-like protein